MISIFNGRERTLGGSTSEVFAQINVDFRQHLHVLKGARLAVFLAISLHTNARGWAWPSRKLLSRETGYSLDTISRTLTDLCQVTINGQRLLLRYQSSNNGSFDSNQYLIFPSPAEVAQFEHSQIELPIHRTPKITIRSTPYSGFPCTVEPCTVEPCTVEPCTVDHYTNKNHKKEVHPQKEEETAAEEAKPAAAAPICPIHNTPMQLRRSGDDTWYSHQMPDGTWCKGKDNGRPTKEKTTQICPICYIVKPIEHICPDCGRCYDCCECDEPCPENDCTIETAQKETAQ